MQLRKPMKGFKSIEPHRENINEEYPFAETQRSNYGNFKYINILMDINKKHQQKYKQSKYLLAMRDYLRRS